MALRLNERIDTFESPFRRLDALIADLVPAPALAPLLMHVGEPQDSPPALLADTVAAHADGWNRYPPSLGSPAFLAAVSGYLARRYPGSRGRVRADREVSSVASTREALYLAASVAVSPSRPDALALMPNPFYQTYRVAAIMAGAQPFYLPQSGFPDFEIDLDRIDAATLARTSILYLCSPSNPEGRVLAPARIRQAVELARRYGFLVVFDECYAELYDAEPPRGALDVLAEIDDSPAWLDNVLVLHSLSKRSSAAGMRSGFVVGAAPVIAALNRVRLNGTACTPAPLLAAAAALWSDEDHVGLMRARLRARFDLADRHLGGHPGYFRPTGGFFLWLKVGDGAALTRRLWAERALKVLPGEYLTQPDPEGGNAGRPFIRIALVQDLPLTDEGLGRLASLL
ncbi:MAG: aminotransferase class I/II-fold pyridoxal phosphate-dependent enzyme [Burkholderiales bacterium]|nr:aminotransferase class I/II-fold pyridoxal phosphate-dependent enzyme [Burkholderiales bacterium]